ncbi:MAG: hypothetical protein B6244_08265 [Candidatus Cloacimonetes bacterium 4572_55]|nr:MAG: hypothetical protein B6244_08265 [Candidatus Cloacimonetes bacterium 4572_55]
MSKKDATMNELLSQMHKLEQELMKRSKKNTLLQTRVDELEEEIEERKMRMVGISQKFEEVRRQLHNMEQALVTSEQRFDLLLSSTPDIFCQLDQSNIITIINDSVKKYGYKPTELIGKNILDFIYPEDQRKLSYWLNLFKEDTWTENFEIRLIHKNGTPIFFEIRSKIMQVHLEKQRSEKNSSTSPFYVTVCIARDIEDRKQIDNNLLQFRKAAQTMPLGLTITDIEGEILYVNPADAKMHGYEAKELIGKNSQIFSPASLKKKMSFQEIRQMQALTRESQNLRKDGSLFPVYLTSDVVKNPDGNPIAIVTTCKDMTDQVFAEEKYRGVFENTSSATVIFQENHLISLCNSKFEELSGYSKNEVENKMRWYKFVSKKDQAWMMGYHKARSKGIGNPPKEYEFEFVDRWSQKKIMLLKVTMLSESKERIASVFDVTSLKEAEDALKKSEIRYRTLFESAPIGIISVSTNGQILDMNSAILKIFGVLTIEKMIRKNVLTFPSMVESGISEDFRTCFEKGDTVISERLYVNNFGETTYIRYHLTPIFDKNRVISGSLAIIEDISQRKKTEEALRNSEKKLKELNQNLRKANASKDKFFSIIAHDLGNSLTPLIGFSEVLVQCVDSLSKVDIVRSAEGINFTAKHLSDLLKNLLDWSLSQSEKMDYLPIRLDLEPLVANTIRSMQPGSDSKGISIHNQIRENSYVYGDENMIATVIRNLLSNAIKFTDQGGLIRIVSKKMKKSTEISIIDNGVGIRAEDLPKIFRIDTNYSKIGNVTGGTKEKGTGLGLIICKEFVEKNRGRIQVESKLGEGSRFIFTLPNQGIEDDFLMENPFIMHTNGK